MRHAGRVIDALWMLLAVAVCAGLYWLAFRIEPHYSSRDGRRFVCAGQFIDAQGQPEGRITEFRAVLLEDNLVEVSRRHRLRRRSAKFQLLARAPNLSRRRAVYLLRAADPEALGDQLTLRMPPQSRTSKLFDHVLAERGR